MPANNYTDEIRNELRENGISEMTYAKVFSMMNLTDSSGLAYVKSKGCWMKGDRSISELRLIGMICDAGDLIRKAVHEEWDESIFSVILPSKLITKIDDQLSSMETISAAGKILSLAQEIMSFGGENISWGDSDEE